MIKQFTFSYWRIQIWRNWITRKDYIFWISPNIIKYLSRIFWWVKSYFCFLTLAQRINSNVQITIIWSCTIILRIYPLPYIYIIIRRAGLILQKTVLRCKVTSIDWVPKNDATALKCLRFGKSIIKIKIRIY